LLQLVTASGQPMNNRDESDHHYYTFLELLTDVKCWRRVSQSLHRRKL